MPTEADGGGKSLTRIDSDLYGNEPDNWQRQPHLRPAAATRKFLMVNWGCTMFPSNPKF